MPRGEALDRWVAAGLAVAAEVVLWTGNATPGLPKGLGAPLALVMTGAVGFRRRHPLAVGALGIGCTALIFLVGGHNYSIPLSVAWMCALYGIAVWTDTRGFVVGLALLAGGNVLLALTSVTSLANAGLFTWLPGLIMLIVRRAVRDRQLLAESLAARAELLEREHEMRANEAVAEERARIARELHDLVAHNVSVMVVQAGVERHALPDSQASTRATLTSIEQAGRQALVEARRLLGVLRRNGESEELEPQPTVDQMRFLVEQVERAGLPVELSVEGDRVPLPAGVDLCAYRIVQEALTNALKHAGPAHAQVLLRYADSGLDIEVRDDGRGLATSNGGDDGGHGLIGMRERVALYGGRLETGPRPGGGFEVRAHLPLA